MILVSNTSPLIILAKIDRLGLLSQLFQEIWIHPVVRGELLAKPGPERTRIESALATCIHVSEDLQLSSALFPVLSDLDPGEQHAINLAHKLEAPLLIDDRRGRAAASRCGVRITGLAGLLLSAKDAGLLHTVGPVLKQARMAGYWLAEELLENILRLTGEAL